MPRPRRLLRVTLIFTSILRNSHRHLFGRRAFQGDALKLKPYGVGVSGGEAEAVYALYVGAPAALRRRPLAFAAFARRFADGGVLRPGLRASARAFRRAPVQ